MRKNRENDDLMIIERMEFCVGAGFVRKRDFKYV
jgi:hypothetical protein